MAGTVTIAGKTFPKSYLYVGGAAVGGIVAYSLWTQRSAPTIDEGVAEVPVDEFGDERITPNTIDTYDVSVDNRTGIKTNTEWTQFVTSYLEGKGYDGMVASAAVGRFLARKPLNSIDVSLVQQAWGAGGEPPEGRPWTIIPESASPAAVGLAAPTGLRIVSQTATSVTLGWSAVTGASGYEVKRDGGGTAKHTGTSHTSSGLHPGGPYVFRVKALNTAGQRGPEAVIRATLKAGGGGSTGSGLPAPRPAATSIKPTAVTIKWAPVPGASGSAISRVGGGQLTQKGRSHTSRGLRPNTSYIFHVRAMKGSQPGALGTVTVKTRS